MTETPVSLLARLCRHPKDPDWERFVMLFTPLLLRRGNRLGIPVTDAEDLLQDVYTTLFRKLPEFRYDPSKSFRAWLWKVFHRQTLAWRKRQLHISLTESHLERFASPDSIAEATDAEYRRALVDRALQLVRTDFPPQTWQIFMQVAVERRTGLDVASEFGVTANAVYLTRARVIARLRQELAELDT